MTHNTESREEEVPKYKVAIVGTPNVGKSIIFNKLTGGRAWVGNWPGVTVEKKVGKLVGVEGVDVEVTDLPGIYSLTAYSVDELIARNFIVEEKPDVVVVVANAANLERSLYLILSLMELEANIVVALNMIDVARDEGYEVMHDKLEHILGVPVIPTIAIANVGINELKKAIINALTKGSTSRKLLINYGSDVEKAIKDIELMLSKLAPGITRKYPLRWLAIKLLENDREIVDKLRSIKDFPKLEGFINDLRAKLEKSVGDVEAYIAEVKFRKAVELSRYVTRYITLTGKVTITDLLDAILTHKVLGIPLALSIIYLLFRFAFDISAPFSDVIDILINNVVHDLIINLESIPPWLASLLADGILAGVGAVLVFLPIIAFFFLGLAVLEDIGYLARLAFVVDKIFHKFNLPGKVMIPLMVGFGCNVPAILATRTIEDENDRKVAALIAPLSSCSARLPVYLAIAGAVMGTYAGAAIATMYWLGIMLALVMGLILRKFVFKGPTTGFIMELPPYLMPRPDSVLLKTWERTKKFLVKAGTVILMGVALVWVLSVTGPTGYLGTQALEDPEVLSISWIGYIGKFLHTVMEPLGWDWKATAALVFGFVAKEIVVGTMGVLYGAGEEGLTTVLSKVFTPITGFAYMVFVLIYVPCIATLAMIRSELGLKYALIALVYEVLLAYFMALLITSLGTLIIG
ncbi:MAG: ferrous iron transport protein B [Thermoprotei archaeon]|nr:MAG: ferrous iron transport protein B [Thermoprotei archaeon]